MKNCQLNQIGNDWCTRTWVGKEYISALTWLQTTPLASSKKIWNIKGCFPVHFTKLLTNGFWSWFEIPKVHHELANLITQVSIVILRTKRNFTWKFEVRKLRVSSTSKLLLKLNCIFWLFCNADLSNWLETFKDKNYGKSYQLIFETVAASRFQLKLYTSDQMALLSMNLKRHF